MIKKTLPQNSSNEPIDIFISFSSKDIDTARFVCNKLEEQGFVCWLADRNRNDISPGENWVVQLMQGLKNSKMVLLIFSRDSNLSRHVQNEIGIAFNRELEILPLRIQDEQPEEVLEYYLIHTQWFDVIPAPPPVEKEKLVRLTEVIKQLLDDKSQLTHSQRALFSRLSKVPFFSVQALYPFTGWVRKIGESMPAIEGALWTYLVMFLVFFVPLAISHRIVGTAIPETLNDLFRVASGFHFYYPDLNAVFFDMILHPAAYAALVYFLLFIGSPENQYLLYATAGFISTKNIRLTRFWINLVNVFVVKLLPLGMAIWSFFYRRNTYLTYGMREPLLFWASFAVSMSIYVFVALSINASYIALLIKSIRLSESQTDDDRTFLSERAGMLAKLTIVFVYIILMCVIEITVAWLMADFNGLGSFDLVRLTVVVFGGFAILVLSAKILWLWIPELDFFKESIMVPFRQIQMSVWLVLTLPVLLVVLTIKLWLQVH